MSTVPPPALRLKSHWFRPGKAHTPAEQASAMAFIVFRVGRRVLERMRGASFDIEVGEAYFTFLREVLVFEVAVVDRMAHARLDAAARSEFTVALVRHLARILADSEDDLLAPLAPGTPPRDERFIDLVNEVVAHYAEFGAEPVRTVAAAGAAPGAPDTGPNAVPVAAQATGFRPDFAFVRYFGSRLAPTLPEKDRPWVLDQVMAAEVPEALALLQRSMNDLHDPSPRRARRASMSGE